MPIIESIKKDLKKEVLECTLSDTTKYVIAEALRKT